MSLRAHQRLLGQVLVQVLVPPQVVEVPTPVMVQAPVICMEPVVTTTTVAKRRRTTTARHHTPCSNTQPMASCVRWLRSSRHRWTVSTPSHSSARLPTPMSHTLPHALAVHACVSGGPVPTTQPLRSHASVWPLR